MTKDNGIRLTDELTEKYNHLLKHYSWLLPNCSDALADCAYIARHSKAMSDADADDTELCRVVANAQIALWTIMDRTHGWGRVQRVVDQTIEESKYLADWYVKEKEKKQQKEEEK